MMIRARTCIEVDVALADGRRTYRSDRQTTHNQRGSHPGLIPSLANSASGLDGCELRRAPVDPSMGGRTTVALFVVADEVSLVRALTSRCSCAHTLVVDLVRSRSGSLMVEHSYERPQSYSQADERWRSRSHPAQRQEHGLNARSTDEVGSRFDRWRDDRAMSVARAY